MPQYTFKEFSTLTGIPSKNLYTYVTRGTLIKKVVLENNKNVNKIDTTDSINKTFLELHEKDTTGIEKEPKKGGKDAVNGQKKDSSTTVVESPLSIVSLEQKKLANKKARIDLQISENKLKKDSGELVELKQTINIVSSYSSTLNKDNCDKMEAYVKKICIRHGIKSDKMGEYVLGVSKIINETSNNAINQLLKTFENE